MPTQPKPRKVGRPKLPKGEAKGTPVQVRFSPEDRQRVEKAAKRSKQTVSEWIRGTLNAASSKEG
jgi:predicted HicB family RNase H-like nuclease